ncbi:16S rRNA (uracil(1498)-N(3))-methyltransferase [soil metagenome]
MGAGADLRDGPHVFVADLEWPVLSGVDRHHVQRVLRLRRGDPITVSDGAGGWRRCRMGDSDPVPDGDISHVARPGPVITVAFAPVKGDKPEWVVQKLTELGVDRIVPFLADRSVVRWDEARARRHHERLTVTAREAAMQCRRCWLPELSPATTFAEVAVLPGVALADRDGPSPSLDRPTIAIGPEGGWSSGEHHFGLPTVGLGRHVLRAETAAVAAATLLSALRDRLVRPG